MSKISNQARLALALAATLAMAGCAVEWVNRQPAAELARQAQPPGSIYAGWRVFQDKCASCHGGDAAGLSGGGPNLLAKVQTLGRQRFVGLVLARYDLGLPPAQADRAAQVEDVLAGRQGLVSMPAWGSEPQVNAHITDLYAYLAARAEGSQGPGRPAP